MGLDDEQLPVWALDVLDLADEIPPGRVMTYGDIAHVLNIPSPRQVGYVMSHHGREVPWHRVIRSDGSLVRHQPALHKQLLQEEGTPMKGDRVDLRKARWLPLTED